MIRLILRTSDYGNLLTGRRLISHRFSISKCSWQHFTSSHSFLYDEYQENRANHGIIELVQNKLSKRKMTTLKDPTKKGFIEKGFTGIQTQLPREDTERRVYLHILTIEDVSKVLKDVEAKDVEVIHVRDRCEWTDYMVFASGRTTRHIRGIADSIVGEVKKRSSTEANSLFPVVEGRDTEHWMVVDCGSIIVHVFHEEARQYYNLEEKWRVNNQPSSNEAAEH